TRVLGGPLSDTTMLLPFEGRVEPSLKALDAFVLPSYFEGLPLAALEAMAAGLPVVATSVGGTPEAVVDGETGLLVDVKDAGALAYVSRRRTRSAPAAARPIPHRKARNSANPIKPVSTAIVRNRSCAWS